MKCFLLTQATSSSIHAFVLFTVLSLLFIIVISKVERSTFSDTIGSQIQSSLPAALAKADSAGAIRAQLRTIPLEKLRTVYSTPDPAAASYNAWLIRTMIIINVFLFIFAVTSSWFLNRECASLKHILLENALLFAAVGAFEYWFFMNVAIKYIPVPPSTLQRALYADVGATLSQ